MNRSKLRNTLTFLSYIREFIPKRQKKKKKKKINKTKLKWFIYNKSKVISTSYKLFDRNLS